MQLRTEKFVGIAENVSNLLIYLSKGHLKADLLKMSRRHRLQKVCPQVKKRGFLSPSLYLSMQTLHVRISSKLSIILL
jgi:hypothetical protein